MSDPIIRVGDHVVDVDAESPSPALVVGRPGLSCGEYQIDESGKTVADVNPEYDPSDGVISVAFLDRSAGDVHTAQTYAYPSERLEVVATLHEEDTDE